MPRRDYNLNLAALTTLVPAGGTCGAVSLMNRCAAGYYVDMDVVDAVSGQIGAACRPCRCLDSGGMFQVGKDNANMHNLYSCSADNQCEVDQCHYGYRCGDLAPFRCMCHEVECTCMDAS